MRLAHAARQGTPSTKEGPSRRDGFQAEGRPVMLMDGRARHESCSRRGGTNVPGPSGAAVMDLQLTSDSPLTWERLQACRVSVPNHVVHRGFASETVLLNVQTGI